MGKGGVGGAAGGVAAMVVLPVLIVGASSGKQPQDNSCSGTGVVTDGSGSVDTAVKFFRAQGLSLPQAAGLVGNFQQESGPSLNPKSVNSLGYSGIAQWGGVRLTLGKDFAQTTTSSWTDLKTQLRYSAWELGLGASWYPGHTSSPYAAVLAKLKQASTSDAAAQVIFDDYESPGDSTLPKRQQYAAAIVTKYQNSAQDVSAPTLNSSPSPSGSASASASASASDSSGGVDACGDDAGGAGGIGAGSPATCGDGAAGGKPDGTLVYKASCWYGGHGVDIFANGGGVHTTVWQCTEMARRFWWAKGWAPKTWHGGVGATLWNYQTPPGAISEPQGQITKLAAGDILSMGQNGNALGHVGIVNYIKSTGKNRWEVQMASQNTPQSMWYFTWDGHSLTARFAGFPVTGVMHHTGSGKAA